MKTLTKFNSDKFAWTDPAQLREVVVVSANLRVPDAGKTTSPTAGPVGTQLKDDEPTAQVGEGQ